MRIVYSIMLILTNLISFSQKETSHWYFGDSVLLHFTETDIINDKTNLSSTEGCASISTKDGKLLFWGTPEKTISFTNKIYKTIGHESSTQGIIYIKHPANDSLIFSFTSDQASPYFNSKLAFHIYRTNGDSVTLNKILWNSITEKLHACNHQNNRDVWIGSHDSKSDSFIFYLIKKEGMVCCPIYQRIGYNFSSGDFPRYNGAGQLKFSPNGKYISTGILEPQEVELFLFNNESGRIVENSKINIVIDLARGLEFDHNSDFLFISANKSLNQYSVKKYQQQDILNSHKTIATYNKLGAAPLQLALDSKIYFADFDSTSIASINKKNKDTFIFKEKSIILSKGKCLLGLPSFNASYFYTPSIDYAYEQDCRTNTIAFEGKDTIKATNYKWVFSKGAKTDTKATKDASYTFEDTGKWQVKYIASNGNRKDTVTKTITIRPKLEQGFLGKDINYCQTLPTLHAQKNLHCIHWYNDTMAELARIDSIKIQKEGTYYAKATNLSFCVEWDTIRVIKTTPKADFMVSDVCENDSAVFINMSTGANRYNWKFGDGLGSKSQSAKGETKHKFQIANTTTFNVSLVAITDGCSDSVSKAVTINQNPSSDFSYVLTGSNVDLKAAQIGLIKYEWKFGAMDSITNTLSTYNRTINLSTQRRVCLKVTNLAGCTSQTCKDVTVGISSRLKENDIKIYPNPSKGKLTIEINKPGNYELKIYNETGQLVLEKGIKGNQVNAVLINLVKGNYLVEIINKEGGRISKKVLIE